MTAVLDPSTFAVTVPDSPDDPSACSDAGLAAELVRVRAQIDRLEAEFARLTWAAHQRGIGAADGSPSTAAWLRRRTGMREGDARAAIEAGAASEVLPRTASAWREGSISSGAVRTIFGARVEGYDAELRAIEPLLLDMARDGVTRQLQQACAQARSLAQADGTEPREHDGLMVSQTYDGRTVLNANLSSTAAEIVTTAIHAFTDPPQEDDRRTAARRRADALVRMAELALASLHGGGPDGQVRARPSCTVVLDWSTLHNGEFGRLDGEFTGTVHRTDVERLLCDCTVSRVVTGPTGLPIDVSPNRRTIPTALRRALVVRDQGCRFPGCRRPTGWCDAHHVIHWRHGGRTILVNLVLLCDHHHHVVHQPGWNATFDGTTLQVYDPNGHQVQ